MRFLALAAITRARRLAGVRSTRFFPALSSANGAWWGPGLATLLVALNFRFRLSRARIREFLHDWLGLELSISTIHQTIHEVAAAVAPAEEELVEAVRDRGLLHADETSWPERGELLWLWIFVSATTNPLLHCRPWQGTGH